MSFTRVFLIVSFFVSCAASSLQAQTVCDSDILSKVERYRGQILNGNLPELTKNIRFPVPLIFAGSIQEWDPVRLEKYSRSIFHAEFPQELTKADTCDLAQQMKIDPDSGRIQSLVLFYDAEDAKYARSAIGSVRQLNRFMGLAIERMKARDYVALSEMFSYPIRVWVHEVETVVENKRDFAAFGDAIIDDQFLNIVTHAYQTGDYGQHPRGLMLNSRGDIWVRSYSGMALKFSDFTGKPVTVP